jgi:hypothetical protein
MTGVICLLEIDHFEPNSGGADFEILHKNHPENRNYIVKKSQRKSEIKRGVLKIPKENAFFHRNFIVEKVEA